LLDGNNVVEDLFCKNITASAKAQDLFEILDTFISENSLEWTKCVGACTDDARSMSSYYRGLQSFIRSKARGPTALSTGKHSRQNILSPTLNQVLEYVVNVNFIKTQLLKARFSKNYVRIWDPNTSLLYYSTSRWISRGNVLSQMFELRQEIYIFLKEEEHKYTRHFVKEDFFVKLAYL
jgi:hypothetical protein